MKHAIPWRDNGLLIASFGLVVFAALVATEYFFQQVQYQEPIIHVDLLATNESDSEESSVVAVQLSSDDANTARAIVTNLMANDDAENSWSVLQQRFPGVSDDIWLEVASSAAKRHYQNSANIIVEAVLTGNANYLPALFQYAQFASDAGDNAAAIDRYQQLLVKHPNHQASLFNLALLLARENRHEEAISVASRAIDASSGTVKAKTYSVRASSEMVLKQYQQAANDFRASIEFRPTHASTWRKLANALLFAQVDKQEILSAFDQAISLQSDYLQALLERGQYYWLSGNANLARQDLEKVRAVAPDYQPVHWSLLHLYLALDKYRSARDEIRWLKNQDLNKVDDEFVDALLLWSKQDYTKAHALLVGIVTDIDGNPWVTYYTALSAVRSKKDDANTLSKLEELLANPWVATQASLALAEAQIKNHQTDQAFAVLQNLETRFPDSPTFAYTLGKAYLDEDFYLESASAFQRAMKLDPLDSQTQLSLGIAYTRAEQYDLALLTYENLLNQFNDHKAGRYNYALLLVQLGRDTDAIQQFQQLMAIDNEYSNTQYHLAGLLAKQGQTQEAVSLLQETLTARPTYHRARELLVQTYFQQGNLEAALSEVDRLVVLQDDQLTGLLLKSDILRDQERLSEAADILLALPAQQFSRAVLVKLFNIGKRALDTEQLILAESCYRAIVNHDPGYDKAYVNLSSALNRLQRYDDTVTLLEQRTDLMAANSKLTINLAEAYLNLGKGQDAVALLEPLQKQNILSDEGALVLAASYRAL